MSRNGRPIVQGRSGDPAHDARYPSGFSSWSSGDGPRRSGPASRRVDREQVQTSSRPGAWRRNASRCSRSPLGAARTGAGAVATAAIRARSRRGQGAAIVRTSGTSGAMASRGAARKPSSLTRDVTQRPPSRGGRSTFAPGRARRSWRLPRSRPGPNGTSHLYLGDGDRRYSPGPRFSRSGRAVRPRAERLQARREPRARRLLHRVGYTKGACASRAPEMACRFRHVESRGAATRARAGQVGEVLRGGSGRPAEDGRAREAGSHASAIHAWRTPVG
jgi:hypothetical protein